MGTTRSCALAGPSHAAVKTAVAASVKRLILNADMEIPFVRGHHKHQGHDNSSPRCEPLQAFNQVSQILQSDATNCIAEVGIVVRPHSLLAAMALQLGLWLETGDDRMLNAVLP